ncbi:acyl-CoA hydrolase [Aequitasia blattaphilus]|uniref:Acyl-CoA thioesterase n=1 Tax=Aequitasia blattaphilus TaxID=2949332 RepID=A0ABT1E6Y7_9FIRM|nr:acyl-CoA thioesterase [Aequitasia blattaphilus]MCP1101595.1 acyl-CoA thioesterase [Aequitasia blattaphilus]MCR8614235.1 acyl-CoA thioesterase [Aequitasia blattaphilus]
MNEKTRTVADSLVETVHFVRLNHLNGAGRLFGGVLIQWIDEVAALVGRRHAKTNVITASVDHLDFIQSAHQNDVIVVIGKATHTGNTSMEVRVDTFVELMDGSRKKINRAFFTMVALDENDKPTPLPKLEIQTKEEEEEWERANQRKAERKRRKEIGF